MNNSGMINWVVWGIIWMVRLNTRCHFEETRRNNLFIIKIKLNRFSHFFSNEKAQNDAKIRT